MAGVKSRTIKSVQNIRTHAGRANQATQPYQAYFRIGALEMEKARRATERQSAMARVRNIDLRVQEIEDEKSALMKKIAKDLDLQKQTLSEGTHSDKKGKSGNFKIRY
jgi:hypothetical protein